MFNRNGRKSILPASESVRIGYSDHEKHKDNYYFHDSKDLLLSKDNINGTSILNMFENQLSTLHWKLFLYSSLFWIVLISYYETSYVRSTLNKCQWNRWEKWSSNSQPHRVALYADPQIMDAHSYPDRPRIINYITRAIVDHYHIRNWKYIQYYLDPDTNFFLGDLFDGGRRWNDQYWINEYERFHSIFPKKSNRKTVFSLPGNHDIGFGDTVIESSFKRFSTFFGETSSTHDVGNHTFVLLDTISLSDTSNENISSVPKEFLNQYSTQKEHPFPRILLTHVPLWRDPEEQQCGPRRESKKPFPIVRGEQYQTVIDSSISQKILSIIAPKYIFSGDDHDYCHIKHTYQHNGESHTTDEITVKSCAMNMGINKPAIQLLSLLNDGTTTDTIQTEICYLPNAFLPLFVYAFFIFANLVLIIYVFVAKSKLISQNYLPMPVGMDYEQKKKYQTINKRKHIIKQSLIPILQHCLLILFVIWLTFYYYYIVV
ncbi:putative lipid phosphatase CDC1 PWA37_000181 [Arxiozyma heterogenica]|uniref:putative lipid phosphatase CDC1 n=1 Tax=Arxiozyma heterogenica TaxID=278026 RepID=UPI002EE67088